MAAKGAKMVASKKGTKKAAKKAAKKATKKAGKKALSVAATCGLTRDEVTDTVLSALRDGLGFEVEADTSFEDIGLEPSTLTLLFIDLQGSLDKGACRFDEFDAAACEGAENAQEIIDAICKDFGIA
jgi:hypothetical protein